MHTPHRSVAALCLTAAMLASGCKKSAAPDDATLTAAVQTRISSDSALGSEPIQSSVQGGIATLSGTVSNDAARSLAADDAARVAGIRTVINNLTVAAPQTAMEQPASVAAPPESAAVNTPRPYVAPKSFRRSAPVEQARIPREQQQSAPAPIVERPVPSPAPIVTPAAPPRKPQPTFRDLSVASGTNIPVRVTQTLDSESTQQGQAFSGVVTSDVLVDGLVAIPRGTAVSGRVDAVQDAGHFRGNSLLTISLTGIRPRGESLPISTDAYSKEGKGRGKNTVEKTGIGAAAGAILGGIFGGGSGAAIGAAAGGGAGAGINGITRGEQVQIPSESIVSFRLTNSINVRVRLDDRDHSDNAADQPDASRRPLP